MTGTVVLPAWVRRAQPTLDDVEVLGTHGAVPTVVSGATAAGRVVLKRYGAGEGQTVATRMRRLDRALRRQADDRLALPAVLGVDDATGVLTQALAPGRPLLPVLRRQGRRGHGLAVAADALASLHACGARLGPVTTVADHITDLIHPHPLAVARALPAVGARIRAILTAILAHDCRPPVAAPLHRDVHARQMLLDGRRMWLVDWDLAAMGDPALDLGNFCVYLRTHLDDGETAARRVVARYARHDPSIARRLPVHEALTYLRLACKTWRLRPAGWHQRLCHYLAAAEQHLSRDAS